MTWGEGVLSLNRLGKPEISMKWLRTAKTSS